MLLLNPSIFNKYIGLCFLSRLFTSTCLQSCLTETNGFGDLIPPGGNWRTQRCQEKGKKNRGKKKSLWKYRRGKCLWNSPGSFDHSCFSYWQQFLFSTYSEERKDGFFLCVVLVSLKKSNPRWYTKKRKSGGIKNRMWLISRGRKKLRK